MFARAPHASLVLGAHIALFVGACATGGSDDAASEGELDGPCYGNDTCDPGYACSDGVCVIPDDRGQAEGICYPNDTCDDPLTCFEGVCIDLSSCARLCATAPDPSRLQNDTQSLEPDELCTETHDLRFGLATTPEQCCGVIWQRIGFGIVPLCEEICGPYYYYSTTCYPPVDPNDQTTEECQAYVDHYNSLECTGADLSETYCESEDGALCSRADYWTCLREGTNCDGATPDIDISGCDASCH